MEVSNVLINGFDKLVDAINQYKGRGSVTQSDGTIKYLDRINVTMTISALTTLELFFLKKITNDFYVTSTIINSKVHPDIKNTNHLNLLKRYNTIVEDDEFDDNIKNLAKNIIPIGSKKYSVIARFSGNSLLLITGVMIDSFILNDMNGYLETKEDCEKRIGLIFKDKFIDYINKETNSINPLFEFMKSEYDYDYSKGLCTLATVETLNGCLNFINNDSESLKNEIDTIKASKIAIDKNDYNIYTFIIDSSFATFLDIYLCSNNIIINYEDFNIVYDNTSFRIEDEILKKYYTRISDLTNDHSTIKKEIKNKSLPKDFSLFNYISYGTPIKYTIKIKENELDNLFNKLDINYESNSLKENISNFIKIVKKTLQ